FQDEFPVRAGQARFAGSSMIDKISPGFAVFLRILEKQIQVFRCIDIECDPRKIHHICTMSCCSGLREMAPETPFPIFHDDPRRRYEYNSICSSPIARWNQSDRLRCGIEREIDLRGNQPRQITRNREE